MNPDPGQTELMEKAERSLNDGNFIAVHGSRSAGSVQEVVKQLYGRFGRPVVVFVDHIHYLTGDMKLLERDRISEAMKVLNALAKDGKATVFVLAQLNREGESKAGLRNLQGSSAIEQDSDNVLILEPAEDETDGAKTYDVILRVKPEKASQITSQVIGGRKCLVIPLDENEHAAINGVNTTV